MEKITFRRGRGRGGFTEENKKGNKSER